MLYRIEIWRTLSALMLSLGLILNPAIAPAGETARSTHDSDTDSDSDTVPDALDNCVLVPNTSQFDADADNIGNPCDSDLNNDCVVNAVDLGLFKQVFFSTDPAADLNEDGVVNIIDLGIFKEAFFGTPGPSGLQDICDPDVMAPGVPSQVTATVSGLSVTLTWEPSIDTGGSGLAGYRVYRDGALIVDTPITTYVDSGLQWFATYSYSVSAYDLAGNESDRSAPLSRTPFPGSCSELPTQSSCVEANIFGLCCEWANGFCDELPFCF